MYTVKKAWNYLEKFKNLKKSNDLHNPSYIAAMQVCLRFFKCYDGPINGKWISTRLALKRFGDKYARFGKVKGIYSSETRDTLEKVLKANEKKLNEDYQGQEEINPKKSSSSEKSTSSNSQKQNSSSSSSSSSSTSSSSKSGSSTSSSSSSSGGNSSSNSSSSSTSSSSKSGSSTSSSPSSSSDNSSNTPSNQASTSSTSTSQQTERTVNQTAVVDKGQQTTETKSSSSSSEVLTAETIQELKNKLEYTLNNINGILTDCKSKLGNLESTINNLQVSSTDQAQKQQVEEKKEDFRQRKTALENKINDLQQKQKDLLSKLSILSPSNDIRNSDFDTLEGKITILNTNVTSLRQAVDTLRNAISTYERSLTPDNVERLKYNVKTFTLDNEFYKTPLFMQGVGKNFGDFLGVGQYEEIFQKWNPKVAYQGKNINTLKNQTIDFPLIVEKYKDQVPPTVEEYKKISPYTKNTKLQNASQDLLVMKKIENKFVLCFYKDGNLAMATEVSPGRKDLGNTPSGVFSLGWKHADHKSSQYNQSPMPYAIHIRGAGEGGIYLYQGYSDGNPQSHGCIRVPGLYQKYLYENISDNSNIPIVIEDPNKVISEAVSTPILQDKTVIPKKTNTPGGTTGSSRTHENKNMNSSELRIGNTAYKIETKIQQNQWFSLDVNSYGAPFMRSGIGLQENHTEFKDYYHADVAYEYFVLLIKNGLDMKKIYDDWKKVCKPNGKTYTPERNNYWPTHSSYLNYQSAFDKRVLLQQAKKNIRKKQYSVLNKNDAIKINNISIRQRMSVKTNGDPSWAGKALPILQKGNEIYFLTYPDYTDKKGKTMLYVGPQGKTVYVTP